MPDIILASSSKYRRALLSKLNIQASCIAPNINESPLANEAPEESALRLAKAKAQAVANRPDASFEEIIIGSDQVAWTDGALLGKPGSAEKAFEQLKRQSGRTVLFHTALSVQQGSKQYSDVITTEVTFRKLTNEEIINYIQQDNPIDCAGSFKSEGAGCMLFKRIASDDPSALIGLPLIRTAEFLRHFGVNPLLQTHQPT